MRAVEERSEREEEEAGQAPLTVPLVVGPAHISPPIQPNTNETYPWLAFVCDS